MGGIKQKQSGLTPDEATHWTQRLKEVFDQGYISRDTFETLKRRIEARLKPDRP